jgi:hypothetical protein
LRSMGGVVWVPGSSRIPTWEDRPLPVSPLDRPVRILKARSNPEFPVCGNAKNASRLPRRHQHPEDGGRGIIARPGGDGDWGTFDFRLSTFDLDLAGLPLSPARRSRERGMAPLGDLGGGRLPIFFPRTGPPVRHASRREWIRCGRGGKSSRHEAESVLSFAAPSGAERHPVRHRGGLPREINPAQP